MLLLIILCLGSSRRGVSNLKEKIVKKSEYLTSTGGNSLFLFLFSLYILFFLTKRNNSSSAESHSPDIVFR